MLGCQSARRRHSLMRRAAWTPQVRRWDTPATPRWRETAGPQPADCTAPPALSLGGSLLRKPHFSHPGGWMASIGGPRQTLAEVTGSAIGRTRMKSWPSQRKVMKESCIAHALTVAAARVASVTTASRRNTSLMNVGYLTSTPRSAPSVTTSGTAATSAGVLIGRCQRPAVLLSQLSCDPDHI